MANKVLVTLCQLLFEWLLNSNWFVPEQRRWNHSDRDRPRERTEREWHGEERGRE